MKYHFSLIMLFMLLLCGCGGTEYTYVDERQEKPGPGILSGEDGVFTVIGDEGQKGKSKEKSDSD